MRISSTTTYGTITRAQIRTLEFATRNTKNRQEHFAIALHERVKRTDAGEEISREILVTLKGGLSLTIDADGRVVTPED